MWHEGVHELLSTALTFDEALLVHCLLKGVILSVHLQIHSVGRRLLILYQICVVHLGACCEHVHSGTTFRCLEKVLILSLQEPSL